MNRYQMITQRNPVITSVFIQSMKDEGFDDEYIKRYMCNYVVSFSGFSHISPNIVRILRERKNDCRNMRIKLSEGSAWLNLESYTNIHGFNDAIDKWEMGWVPEKIWLGRFQKE